MEEILKAIKAALKTAGVNEKHAERVQKLFKIEKEENIDSFVALFKENVLPAIEEAGKESGKTVKQKAIEEYEKKHNLKDGKAVEPKKTDEPDDGVTKNMTPEMKALFEAQQKSIKELSELVSGVVKTTSNAQKLVDVKAALKGKVDEKFIERVAGKVNLDAEDLDSEIAAQVKDHTDFVQSIINDEVGNNYVPKEGKTAEKSEKEWAEFMNSGSGDEKAGVVDLGL